MVSLFADDCVNGDIRLVNGKSEMEGRVEVCSSRRWGTVCDSYWTDNHTAVVCRQLGFSDIIGGRLKRPYNLQVYCLEGVTHVIMPLCICMFHAIISCFAAWMLPCFYTFWHFHPYHSCFIILHENSFYTCSTD